MMGMMTGVLSAVLGATVGSGATLIGLPVGQTTGRGSKEHVRKRATVLEMMIRGDRNTVIGIGADSKRKASRVRVAKTHCGPLRRVEGRHRGGSRSGGPRGAGARMAGLPVSRV